MFRVCVLLVKAVRGIKEEKKNVFPGLLFLRQFPPQCTAAGFLDRSNSAC